MAQQQPIRKATPASGSDIPDKLYFRIGEVAKLCDVPAYVLRFWESEFPISNHTKAALASVSIAVATSRWPCASRISSTTRATPFPAHDRSSKAN